MSLRALSWAFENHEIFCSSNKFVLIALANYASETGKAYPSVETICKLTQLSDDTVRRSLKALAADDVIKDTGKRFGATQQVKVWQLPDAAWKLPSELQVPKDPRLTGLSPKTTITASNSLQVVNHETVACENGNSKTRERPAKDPRKTRTTRGEPITVNREQRKEVANAILELPESLRTSELKAAWSSWLDDRRARHKPVTPRGAELCFRDFKVWGADVSVRAIENSIRCGYQGIFKPKMNSSNGHAFEQDGQPY